MALTKIEYPDAAGEVALSLHRQNFADRAEFLAATVSSWVSQWSLVESGLLLEYVRDAAGTAIESDNGVAGSPAGTAFPEHFGAQGDGTADDHAAFVTWAAFSGAHEARPGETYASVARTAAIAFAAGSTYDFKGAVFSQQWTLNNNNGVFNVNAGARVENLTWAITGENYYQRGATVYSGAQIVNWQIDAETPFPATDDNFDGGLIIRGTDVLIEGCAFTGHRTPIRMYDGDDQSRCRIINNRFYDFTTGISLRGNGMTEGVIDGVYVHSIHPSATTDAGQNVVNGAADRAIVRNVYQMMAGKGSGEHFIYSSAEDGTSGMVFESIYNNGSGQCFMKFRGHDGLRLTDCHGSSTSTGNTPGTNEDAFRFEYCRNVKGRDLSCASTDAGPSGYDGIHIVNSWNIELDGVRLQKCTRSYVRVQSPPDGLEGYTSPPNDAVEGIIINGLYAREATTKPLLSLGSNGVDLTVTVGDIHFQNVDWDGELANLVVVDAGVSVVQLAGTSIRISGVMKGLRFNYVWEEGADPVTVIESLGALTPDAFAGGTDAEKVQAAIDAAYARGGGTILIDREFIIDEPILLYPNVTFRGGTGTARFKRADLGGVFDMFELGAEGGGMGFADIEIDGNRDGQAADDENSAVFSLGSGSTSGPGGNEPNSNRFFLHGCRIFNWSYQGQGLNILGFRGVRVSECEFEDGGSDLWHAIYARRVSDFQCVDSRFKDVYGASIKAMSIGRGGRAVVSSNICENTLRGVNLTDFDDCVISDNVIQNVVYGNAYGITVAKNVSDASPRRVVVSGNTVTRCRTRGIAIANALQVAVIGNTVTDCGESLISLRGCKEVLVGSNMLAFRDLADLVDEVPTDPGDDLEEVAWEHNPPFADPATLTVAAIRISQGALPPTSIQVGSNVYFNGTTATTHVISTDATSGEIIVPRNLVKQAAGFSVTVVDPNGIVKGQTVTGTFTPEYAPATGAFAAIAYDSFRSGQYTVTPDGLCTFSLTIRTDEVTLGTASGAIYVTGLPFAAPSTATLGEAAAQPVQISSSGFTANPVEGFIEASSSRILLRKRTTATGDATSLGFADLLNAANSNTLRISGTYRISSSITI